MDRSIFQLRYDVSTAYLALAGVFDAQSAEHVVEACELLCRLPSHRATIDLSDVEEPSAAALERLRQAVDRARAHGVHVVLHARCGSVAEQALADARVPHLMAPSSGSRLATVTRRAKGRVLPSQRVAGAV
jgi:anti-anti-sigma regulatory factor